MPKTYRLELVDPETIVESVRVPAMRGVANLVKKHARRLTPRGGKGAKTVSKKGRGRDRLYRTVDSYVNKDATVAAVYSKAPHAHLVHEGTAPHVTPLVSKHVFKIGERFVRKSTLHHPGARAHPYLTDAADQARPEIPAAVENAIDKAEAKAAARAAKVRTTEG